MTAPAAPPAPFGRVLTAMVTPFAADGSVDLEATAQLAVDLVDAGHDGLAVNGTTGEAPTTTDDEKDAVLRTVLDAVGTRASVLAGVGTNVTEHTLELARTAEKAGAAGLLVVTPYYSKPPQTALLRHFTAVADSTGLPVMLYDIPGRAGVPIATDTLLRLAEHPRIAAVKDAKGDLWSTAQVLAATDLAVYSGDDALNLPLLALGGCGVVSVVGHLVGDRLAALVAAHLAGDVAAAARVNAGLVPVVRGVMTRTQGVVAVKAALGLLGRAGGGPLRAPLYAAEPEVVEVVRRDLAEGGLPV